MKKKLLLVLSLAAVLCCLLALSVCAEDNAPAVTHTFYVVQSQDSQAAIDLKAQDKEVIVLSEVYASTAKGATNPWLDNFANGSHIELIFAENIVESIDTDWGIVLSKKITLTVKYNGFSHYVTNTGRSNAFVLRHADASIRFIGTHAIDGEDGQISHSFKANSANLDGSNVDVYHGKVYCWIYDGDAYAYNVRAKTGEEFIFTTVDDDASNSKTNTITVHSCAVYWIGISGDADKKIIDFKDSYIENTDFESLCTGSVIDNCVFGNNYFYMDCHGITNQMLIIKNCTLDKVKTDTGRTHVTFIDCKINFSNFTLGSDGGGAGYALVYTSVACETDGELKVYKNGSGTTPVNDQFTNNDSKYAQTVADFYADPQNKAYGHSYGWEFSFNGAKYLSACTAQNACASCKDVIESVNIDAMLVFLGYSVPEFGQIHSITLGIQINSKAISDYEGLTGSLLNYGFTVALKDKLGEGAVPLDANGEAVVLQSGNVIKADITGEKNAYADLVVSIPDTHVDTLLLMCAFVIEQKGDSLEISYAQNSDSLVESNLFSYISYNNH